MKKQKFLEFAKVHRGVTFGPKAPFGLTWAEYSKFTKLLDNLDFGCDIKEGICVSKRNVEDTSKECCCYSCASNVGYLRNLPKNDEVIANVAKLFDAEKGFWHKNKGCTLTKRYRSKICVCYRCGSAKDNFFKDAVKGEHWTDRHNAMQIFVMSFVDYARLHDNSYNQESNAKIIRALI